MHAESSSQDLVKKKKHPSVIDRETGPKHCTMKQQLPTVNMIEAHCYALTTGEDQRSKAKRSFNQLLLIGSAMDKLIQIYLPMNNITVTCKCVKWCMSGAQQPVPLQQIRSDV